MVGGGRKSPAYPHTTSIAGRDRRMKNLFVAGLDAFHLELLQTLD